MWKKIIWENLEMMLIALLIVIPIRAFVIQPFIVYGSSMEPNFYSRDYLIIDELSYHFRSPSRYEVIVFKAPNQPSHYYIKRIIGLPNENIDIKDNKIVITKVNGETFELEEKYLEGENTSGSLSLKLGPNQYFVLGDNRSASYDSRNWGPLDKDLIIGRVWLRLWPYNRIMAFSPVPSN
ncbi:MAG TPA: signal peptidase I [Candidatus Paceibacterota bacterium]|nr:signal peptidase I [Candidatus Paceibacterota bacterium]